MSQPNKELQPIEIAYVTSLNKHAERILAGLYSVSKMFQDLAADLDTKEIPLCLFSKWVGPYQAEMGQNLQEVRETGTPCRFVRRIYSLNRPRKIAMMFQMEPQICQARTSRMTTDKMVAKVVITLAPYFSLMRAPVSRSNRWVLSPRTSSLMTSPA